MCLSPQAGEGAYPEEPAGDLGVERRPFLLRIGEERKRCRPSVSNPLSLATTVPHPKGEPQDRERSGQDDSFNYKRIYERHHHRSTGQTSNCPSTSRLTPKLAERSNSFIAQQRRGMPSTDVYQR